MKNKILAILLFFCSTAAIKAENLIIESKQISIDKNRQISIFEKEVVITTPENQIIESDYAEYNKKDGIIILKKNVKAIDNEMNKVYADYAEYNEEFKTLNTIGKTNIKTSEGYILEGKDILFDNLNKYIKSKSLTTITDQNNNKIYLNNFEYLTNKFIFKSIGEIKLENNLQNTYNF